MQTERLAVAVVYFETPLLERNAIRSDRVVREEAVRAFRGPSVSRETG